MSDRSVVDPTLISGLDVLPTGKTHVSFSELRDWQECTYRHKVKYVKKITDDRDAAVLDFGTAIHSSCEDYLRTRIMKPEIAINFLKEAFSKKSANEEYTSDLLEQYTRETLSILEEVPSFMSQTFGDWVFIDAEHLLYEKINDKHNQAFKGYIDGVIESRDGNKKGLKWILDWKSTSWGWPSDKKTNPDIARQLVYYKKYWHQKNPEVPIKDIRCGFVLLKRTAKKGSQCELIKVSVGDVTLERSAKIINSMLNSVKKGIAIKNRESCKYCPFKETEHCT